MTGSKYVYEKDVISLILFTDGVNYNKSANKSVWAILSSIVELPPILRNSYENINFHSIWSGTNPNFNNFLKNENKEIDFLLKNGIKYKNILLKIRIFCFISDTPARGKALNMKLFNGKMACIMCMHPTEYTTKTIYPMLNENIKLRTHSTYIEQVQSTLISNKCEFGIYGVSYLSNWMILPDSVIFDYMHMCLQGTFKYILCAFFERKNHKSQFYLGKLIRFLQSN